MKRIIIPVMLSLVSLCLDQHLPAQEAAGGKKLIEWGWDEPDTAFMRQNIQSMEQMPFDGLVFHVHSSKGGNLSHETWGSRKFELAEFQHAIDDLAATPFHHFTERFLRVNVTPGNVDWFDDNAWAIVLQNFAVAAQVARQGGCKGFMFDTEMYNFWLFSFEKQYQWKDMDDYQAKFDQYRAKLRQRGGQWMKAVSSQYPSITILLTYAYSETGRKDQHNGGEAMGLLADFVDGMLDACPPQLKLVDAWEGAYRYREKQQFVDAYKTIHEALAQWSAAPDKYRWHVQAGFGIWMDADWRQVGWHVDDLSKNSFTPAQLEETVRLALHSSDEYVWIYTEQPRWWTNERLPKAYVDALVRAREAKGGQDEQ